MLFILSSLFFLFNSIEKNSLLYLALSGIAAGLALATREFSLAFLILLILFVLWASFKRKRYSPAGVFLISLIPPLFLWGYYNSLRTGLFFLTPIMDLILSGSAPKSMPDQNILIGLYSLLLSKGGSIFIYSPILLISLFGWGEFFRKSKNECILIFSVIVTFLFLNAKINYWIGSFGWGPRYTLEITPLILLPLAYWFKKEIPYKRIKKRAFVCVCAFSLLIQLSGTLTNWHARRYYQETLKGAYMFLYTAKYSQWWDCLKTLFINLWNLILGSFIRLENPGYDNLSPASLYTSKTVYTWWNRLLFMGINRFWIIFYIALTLAGIFYLLRNIKTLIRELEGVQTQA